MTETLRRVPSSVGDPIRRDAIVSKLVDAIDGATVLPSGNDYAGSGILVAVPEFGAHLTAEVMGGLTTAQVRALVGMWVTLRAREVDNGLHPRAFGIWHARGAMYLDVVDIFSDAEEDDARNAGRVRDQIAIWHNGRREEIPTGGTGGSQL